MKITENALNFKKIIMKVTNCEVKKGGFFSSDYLMHTITTTTTSLKWKVQRKDADFYTLRKQLLR